MEVIQNYQLVNKANQLAFGQAAITVTDLTTLGTAGEFAKNFKNGYELFNQAIADVIAQTFIDNAQFDIKSIKFLNKASKFGGFVREIYTDMPTAVEDGTWEITNQDYEITMPDADVLPITVKCYQNRGTHRFKWKVPDVQLDSAFHSNEELQKYISGMLIAVENAIKVSIVNLSRLVRCKYMAEIINATNTTDNGSVVDLYDLYVNEYGDDAVAFDARKHDKGYLTFCSKTIAKYKEKLGNISSLFINEKTEQGNDYVRQVDDEHLVFEILQDAAKDFEYNMESDTYHNEIVKLKGYNEVDFWQGTGTKSAFDDLSTIKVKLGETTSGGVTSDIKVEQSGILGVMYDDRAIMQVYEMEHAWAQHYDWDRFSVCGMNNSYGYAYKLSYPAIVFVENEAEKP